MSVLRTVQGAKHTNEARVERSETKKRLGEGRAKRDEEPFGFGPGPHLVRPSSSLRSDQPSANEVSTKNQVRHKTSEDGRREAVSLRGLDPHGSKDQS
jgi:hypothetical protein